MEMLDHLADGPWLSTAIAALVLLLAYLARLNQLLLGVPDEIKKLTPTRWTKDLVVETYRRLEAQPITTSSYAKRIPPRLERRYIVTGGSGEFTSVSVPRHGLCDGNMPISPRSRTTPLPRVSDKIARPRGGVHRAAAP